MCRNLLLFSVPPRAGLVRPQARSSEVPGPAARPQPDPRLRAGDAERDAVIDLLGQALALGYLEAGEFDARTDRAIQAATLGDLQRLTEDLPVERIRPVVSAQPRPVAGATRAVRRAAWAGFALVSVICLVVWVATAAVVGPYHFWPVWPILGMGAALVTHLPAGPHGRSLPLSGR
jgi:Domain of unknown function (DUF1707)